MIWNIISPHDFDEEWITNKFDGAHLSKTDMQGNVFKEPDGSIHYNGAFIKLLVDIVLIQRMD